MHNNTDFELIYSDFADMVYNLSMNYMQNEKDAQDITQEVFIKVYQELDKFNEKSSLKTWVYRITINQCLDQIKKSKTKKRFGFTISLFGNSTETYSPIEFKHPGVLLENQEELEQLFNQINKLPEKQKTALILKSIEGLSQKEIAEIMGQSEKAIESLLSRARKNLKINLNQEKDLSKENV